LAQGWFRSAMRCTSYEWCAFLTLSILAHQNVVMGDTSVAQEPPLLGMFSSSLWQEALVKLGFAQVPRGPRQPLKIIGAGLGRTGTNSLMLALDRLGYKTYHMERAFKEGHQEMWAKVGNEFGDLDEARLDDAIRTLSSLGYNATVDFPTTAVYEELLSRYPDALVVLSVTSPSHWAKSYTQTVGRMPRLQRQAPLRYVMSSLLWMSLRCGLEFDGDLRLSEEAAVTSYVKWEERVKATVPSERLLVHSVTEGWAPLCDFFGVPPGQCPSDRGEPYPRGITGRAQLTKFIDRLEMVTRWWWLILSCLVDVLCWFLLYLYCSCRRASKLKVN